MQQFLRYAEHLTGLGTEDNGIFVGGVRMVDMPEVMEVTVKQWVQHHQPQLNTLWTRFFPFARKPIVRKRLFTFEEYQTLFEERLTAHLDHLIRQSKTIDHRAIYKQFYTRYPVYEFFEIKTEDERKQYALLFENSLEGYYQVLKASRQRHAGFFFSWLKVYIPEPERWKHTYVVGGSGSGKTEQMKTMLLQYLKRDFCANVVIDPHGDFAEQVALFQENLHPKREGKLVYIDPFLHPDYTPVINPFDLPVKNSDTIDKAVQELTKAFQHIFIEAGAGFTAQMEMLLASALDTVLRMENGTMRELQRFMDDNNNKDLVELGLKNPNEAHRQFFASKFKDGNYKPTKVGVYSRLQKLLASNTFSHLVSGKSTINLQQLIKQKKLIIFNLSKGKMGSYVSQSYGRLLVAMLQTLALNRAFIPEHLRTPTHLYIDEFHNYVSLSIKELLEESRKYRLYLTMASQVVGQNMSPELEQTVLGNTHVKVIGKCDYKSRARLSKEIGMKADALEKLEVGEFIVKMGSKTPFKMKGSKQSLGHKNSMKKHQWEAVKAEQLERYYILKTKPVVPTIDDEEREERQEDEGTSLEEKQTTPSNARPKKYKKKRKFTTKDDL